MKPSAIPTTTKITVNVRRGRKWKGSIMEIRVYHEEESYLEPREVAARLVRAMPTVLVDWNRGNRLVEEKRQQLISQNAPDVILRSHDALVNQTAYIQLSFPQFQNDYVFFVVQPNSAMDFKCSDPSNDDLLLLSANQAASALGYKVFVKRC